MKIQANNLGKKYNKQWIFRHLDLDVQPGDLVAVTGHNGSGKSTLVKILGGFIAPTEGKIAYGQKLEHPQLKFNFVAPYLNLLEEFTLIEHLEFHSKFKQPLFAYEEMLATSGLIAAEHKLVKEFSSGMKQRLRLILAFFYEGKVLLLDEPTSNLDEEGSNWYQHLLKNHKGDRLIFVASNQPSEYQGATQVISIEKFKFTK